MPPLITHLEVAKPTKAKVVHNWNNGYNEVEDLDNPGKTIFRRYHTPVESLKWEDLRSLYDNLYSMPQQHFFKVVAPLLPENVSVDSIRRCAYCNNFKLAGETKKSDDGYDVCESCIKRYSFIILPCCDKLSRNNPVRILDSDERICNRCAAKRRLYYCGHCQAYSTDQNHYHPRGCQCESPQAEFVVGNVAQNTRTTISLPAGEISEQGISLIQQQTLRLSVDLKVRDDIYLSIIPSLGIKWQTKEGNFTKRLSRAVFNKHKVKIPADVLERIGQIAGEHSKGAGELHLEVTRDLNGSPASFGNEGSCWWQSYTASRCTLKSNGGFALRTFGAANKSNKDGKAVLGRAWVLALKKEQYIPGAPAKPGEPIKGHCLCEPCTTGYTKALKAYVKKLATYNEAVAEGPKPTVRLVPTFDTQSAVAYLVFNGYGNLSGYIAARALSQMTGWTYRKTGFTTAQMYINAGGYLVTSEDIATTFTDASISMKLTTHSDLFTKESYHAK